MKKERRNIIMTNDEIKKLSLEDMKKYIEKNAPKDKEWFKSIALDEKGNYHHFKAKSAFKNKYFPELKAEPKTKVGDKLKNW